MSMLITLGVMILAFWLMSSFARRQQKRMTEEQERRTEEALVPGTWVRTRAGFYGTVVEVDGDVVTLSTPLGDESLWAKSAVVGAEEPPFASTAAEHTVLDAPAGSAEPLATDPVIGLEPGADAPDATGTLDAPRAEDDPTAPRA